MDLNSDILEQLQSEEIGAFHDIDSKKFLRTFIRNEVRPDGRTLDETRKVKVGTGVYKSPLCVGSSLVRWGGTSVSCSVSVMVGTPHPNTPKQGAINFSVALWPICSPIYDRNKKCDEAYMLESVLNDVFVRSKSVDLEQLCIAQGRCAFCLCFEVVALSTGGGLLDAMVLAASAALARIVLPDVCLDENTKICIEDTGESSATESVRRLTVRRHIVSVSCGVVRCDHGDASGESKWALLIDPSSEEEGGEGKKGRAMDGLVTVACDQSGNMCYVNQTSYSQDGTLPIQTLSTAIEFCCSQIEAHIRPQLDSVVAGEGTEESGMEVV